MRLLSDSQNLQKVGHDIVIFNGNVLGHAWHTWCENGTNGKRMSCSLLIGHMQIFKLIYFRTMGLWIWITFFWYALYMICLAIRPLYAYWSEMHEILRNLLNYFPPPPPSLCLSCSEPFDWSNGVLHSYSVGLLFTYASYIQKRSVLIQNGIYKINNITIVDQTGWGKHIAPLLDSALLQLLELHMWGKTNTTRLSSMVLISLPYIGSTLPLCNFMLLIVAYACMEHRFSSFKLCYTMIHNTSFFSAATTSFRVVWVLPLCTAVRYLFKG